eukprot:PhF_6_TR8704/c0_g1_i2/m.13643
MSEPQMERTSEETEKFLRTVSRGTVPEIMTLLAAKPNLLSAEDASGRTALHFAAYLGRADVVEAIVSNHRAALQMDHQDFDNNTALALAVKQRNPKIVALLLDCGANGNLRLSRDVTAFHHACCVADNVAVLRLLISKGATDGGKVFTEAIEGGSPLHWACHTNDVLNAAFLIDDCKMDINIKDVHGGTPLFVAVAAKNHEMMRFLLERGANVAAVASDKSTPMCQAANEPETKDLESVKILVTYDYTGKYGKDFDAHEQAAKDEICKPRLTPEERAEKSNRFKTQGNNAFSSNEFVKANKFYSLAISFDVANHVLFSNRSACFFNVGQFRRALADARHCVKLNSGWSKGYFRVAAALMELGELEEAEAVCKAGLAIDGANENLKTTLADVRKKMQKAQAAATN